MPLNELVSLKRMEPLPETGFELHLSLFNIISSRSEDLYMVETQI